MRKITLLFCAIFLGGFMAKAQAPLQEGELQLNAGFGISNYGLPVYGGLEMGVGNNISVGGELSYRAYHENSSAYKWNHSIVSLVAMGNYHFNELLEIPSNWDFYAGLSLGYSSWSTSVDGDGNSTYTGDGDSGMYLAAQIGGRYFFQDNLGVNLEIGGGNYSGGKIGITYKF